MPEDNRRPRQSDTDAPKPIAQDAPKPPPEAPKVIAEAAPPSVEKPKKATPGVRRVVSSVTVPIGPTAPYGGAMCTLDDGSRVLVGAERMPRRQVAE